MNLLASLIVWDSLPTKSLCVKRHMASDPGWLALSDLDNKIASPFSVLLRKKSNLNLTLMASDFDSLIYLYSLKGFVIGIPWDRHRVSSDAVRIKSFVNDLSKTNMLQGLPYTFWNEQFTSKIWMEREWVKANPFLAPI
ncbi:hypothetical protein RIF29_37796 [Crotalaria pallida]|uniref:YqgF/RNase H-like domain-containing protein n=1 Tax=Crotalaria pallida TaxID=3830 RepID=A0AAN9DY06_CROPI